MDPICTLSATRLADLIAEREVTSREVVEAHLARIDEVNGAVNAVTVVLGEPALEAADAADAALASRPHGTVRAHGTEGGDRAGGALHGVLFTVKENIDCVGSATTHGVPFLAHSMPSRDAPVVARMRAAGAIPIARTNLSEFALRIGADNPLRGATLNPWDPRVTPGGSSGGDAAALATGMTPFGLGNDLGGSLRNPAYCCGIAALKPTTGRIPRAGSIPPLDFGWSMQAMAVDGPMARSVADLRLGLEVLSGRDVRDPRSVDAPLRGPAPAALRAALVTQIPGVKLPPGTVADLERAGLLLAAAGWEVEEAQPPELDLVTATWLDFIAVDFSVMMPDLRPMVSRALYDYMAAVCDMSAGREAPNSELHATRSRLIRLWSEFFVRYPVAIGPTWTRPPWPLDADLEPGTGARLVYDTVRFITPGNLLGIPSVAVPTGVAAGLPMGIQVYADLWREDLCLDAAAIIEAGVDAPAPIDPLR
jgi:amidase